MPSDASTIGIVIRTLNESELIGRCLDTLRRQRCPLELDIVVVDSGSTDATREIARSHGARIIELPPDEFDYSRALNVGIEEARGDVVVSLSAHAIPLDDQWLDRMTVHFSEPRVAGVASGQVPWPDASWREARRLRDEFGGSGAVYVAGNADGIVFSNAASSIRRSAWRDEPFTLPAVEDLEWARRVVAAGWSIVYEPQAAVYHSHRESPRALARRLIDISRAHDADAAPRTRRRTAREAAGLVVRDSRSILALHEPLRRKLGYLTDLMQTACYYVVDFSRPGTTAERRQADLTS